MHLKHKIFSHYPEQPLPFLLLNADPEPITISTALFAPSNPITSLEMFLKATNKFKDAQLKINFLKVIAIELCVMFACFPITNANFFLTILFLLANCGFVLWEDSDDKGWIYSLGILARTLTVFGFYFQYGQELPTLPMTMLLVLFSLGFLHNVLVLAVALLAICLVYMARVIPGSPYTMFGQHNQFQLFVPNGTIVLILARHLLRVYDMRTVLKRQIQKNTLGSQLENLMCLLMPKTLHDRIRGGAVVLPQKEREAAFAVCLFDTNEVYPMEKREVLTQYYEKLYGNLDRLCSKHDLTKVQTYGNTYLAVCKQEELNPQKAIICCMKFAFSLSEFAQTSNQNIKIVVGFGGVFECVLGYHKPQYTLIGEQINEAARIFRNGDNSQVFLTSSAYEFVNTANEVVFTELKSERNGRLQTYYGARKRRNSSVELKILNITLCMKNVMMVVAADMKQLPEMTMENVELLITECRPVFEDLRN